MSPNICRGGSGGFSLAETIIAMGVIAGVFLVVAALFTQLLRGTQKEADVTAGTLLTQKVMTDRLQRIYANLDPVFPSKDQFFSTDAPALEGTVILNKTTYSYRITHQTIDNVDTGEPLGGDPSNQNRVKKLDALVWWGEEPEAVRSGTGLQRMRATRLINENFSFE